MKKWTKEHSKFVGRIIFADLLELPLEKYRRFIEKVEESPLFDKHHPRHCEEPKALTPSLRGGCRKQPTKQSHPNVIAEIVRSGKRFIIRYTYEGFDRTYVIARRPKADEAISSFEIASAPAALRNDVYTNLWYKLRRISSRNELTHKILKGIIEHQREYLKTGNPADLVPFSQIQLPIDNSWTSRLVNRLSVITPHGEEKSLKWFFQTGKDINKRLIKQLLDRENEDIESGRLKKPLTDNQIRAELESGYGLSLSRWSIGHCRKDMGIPPANRRLSGYKYPPLSANFSMLYPLTIDSVQNNVPASPGIYEFRLKGKEIEYPNGRTQVMYIGSTKNIKKRLREHLGKNSKNGHIREFLKKYKCSFRYIEFSKNWKVEEGRLYSLFVNTYGGPPKSSRVRPYCVNN